MTNSDYYQILGVTTKASQKQIKDAFRQRALKYHPDRNPGDGAAADRMKAVNEAYAVLSHPKRRAEYDTLRQQFGDTAHSHFRNSHSDQDIFHGSDINQIFEELARSFGLRGVDEIFKDVYGQGYQHFEFRRPGMFGRGFIFIGGSRPPRAPSAGEAGTLGRLSRRLLGQVGGLLRPARGRDLADTIRLSPELARQGGAWAYEHKKRGKKLVVKIPAGVHDGQQIRLAGMGTLGRGESAAGDLLLKVVIQRPLFARLKGLFGARRPRR